MIKEMSTMRDSYLTEIATLEHLELLETNEIN
jgi:hypothetical protein